MAKKFRAGKISLLEFTQQVFPREGGTFGTSDSPQQPGSAGDFALRVGEAISASTPLRVPQRKRDCHKGDVGRLLFIGGSLGMSGAIGLSGLAALRSGAGLVSIATPDLCLPLVSAVSPCLMTRPLVSQNGKIAKDAARHLEILVAEHDVVGIGPGLGREPDLDQMVLQLYESTTRPMVCDADALNALASQESWIARSLAKAGPRVLTPHPGEFVRLARETFDSRQAMCQAAQQLAAESQTVIVLKGHNSLITDGVRQYYCQTGNPGMATAGSGDVLTGMIAALIGQGLDVFSAAVTGCHLHGLSGDLAIEVLGEHSLMATDIIDFLPKGFSRLRDSIAGR
ncbi:MAG TPA: NAD(P)H-hydrate dehydratase [Pirellulaceae bacterium]|nr:NAD(P)H-hydrate dehydratase [Pirellulaceae bacterium]